MEKAVFWQIVANVAETAGLVDKGRLFQRELHAIQREIDASELARKALLTAAGLDPEKDYKIDKTGENLIEIPTHTKDA